MSSSSAPTSDQVLKFAFDEERAAAYDERFARMAAARDGLQLIAEIAFGVLPERTRFLCVGVGTGTELIHLAKLNPRWHFTAVEPARAMLNVCRRKVEAAGLTERCTFHEGYIETLPDMGPFHAATSLLVSHFILDQAQREEYFRQIARRLLPGGLLLNADLCGDVDAEVQEYHLQQWQRLFLRCEAPKEEIEAMRNALQNHVALLPPQRVVEILTAAGFSKVMPSYHFHLIRGWVAQVAE